MVDDTLPSAPAQAPEGASAANPQTSGAFGPEFADPPDVAEPTVLLSLVEGQEAEDFPGRDAPEEIAETLSFDPAPQAGGAGLEEDDEDDLFGEAPAGEYMDADDLDEDDLDGEEYDDDDPDGEDLGYVPPVRPDWIEALPEEARPQAEALFNGMAKLHREQAEYTAYRAAIANPETAAQALRGLIGSVAERYEVSVPELLTEYVVPEIAPGRGFEEDSSEYEDDSESDEESGVAPDAVLAALEAAGIDPSALRAQQAWMQQQAQSVALQGARSEWISAVGAPLAEKIARHPEGFSVTPEEVTLARERAYLAGDDEALKDPLLAVQRMFPQRYAEAYAVRRNRRPRAPSLSSSSGSGPEDVSGFGADDFDRYMKRIGV